MGTISSISSLLSQWLNSSSSSTSGTSSPGSSADEAVLNAVNAILNSATQTSGSGLDVTSTVDAILEADAAPYQQMESQESTLNSQNSALKTIESDLESLQNAVWPLSDFVSGAFSNVAVTSSNNDVVSATAENGTAAGNHTITVSQLATTSSSYSADFTSATSSLPTGSFGLQVGSNGPTTIYVDNNHGTDTLKGLAAYINGQNLGVTASVISDASGARLALVSQSSGTAGSITISNDTTGTSGMRFTTTAGKDATLNVDGIPIDSSSNTVTGVIPGVTLTLESTSSAPVTLGMTPDLNSVSTAINNFVSAYNTAIKDINAQYNYNSTSGSAPPLLGDTTLDLVQQQLLGDITTSITGNSGYVNLQSIGISVQNDGTLSVDSNALNNALSNNFSAVQNLFQSTAPFGVAEQLNSDLTWLTDPTQGPLNVDMSSNSQQLTDLNNQITDFETNLAAQQQQLTDEYSTINTTLEQLPEAIAQVNAQLNSLNPTTTP